MLTAESFIAEIETFLQASGTSASAFGRAAVGDPNFVSDLRSGRMPNLRIVGKVQAFIAARVSEGGTASTPTPAEEGAHS